MGSASAPVGCVHLSSPAAAAIFAVWSNSSLGIASNTHSGAASCCPFIASGGERAAPAALERKHPVDTRQQLRPHIARYLSRPRGAGNFAYRLWPGCLAPRRQLPAGLHRHQRPPRRVRRQYPKVAVPMLARRRYQHRYSIRKLAGTQPQFYTS